MKRTKLTQVDLDAALPDLTGWEVLEGKLQKQFKFSSFAAAIGWKLGRKVTFDPKTELFVNDAEANRRRAYKRRAPYTI